MTRHELEEQYRTLMQRSDQENRLIAMHGEPGSPGYHLDNRVYQGLAKHTKPKKWTPAAELKNQIEERGMGKDTYNRLKERMFGGAQ